MKKITKQEFEERKAQYYKFLKEFPNAEKPDFLWGVDTLSTDMMDILEFYFNNFTLWTTND